MKVKNIGVGVICVVLCGLVMAQTSVLGNAIDRKIRNGSELTALEKFSCTWMHCGKTHLLK